MLQIKCDNDDGTINWKSRAKIAVFTAKLIGETKRSLLKSLRNNPSFVKLVGKEWDRISKREKKHETA